MHFTEFIDAAHFAKGYTLQTPVDELKGCVDFIHITNFQNLYNNQVVTEHCFESFGINLLFTINQSCQLVINDKVNTVHHAACVLRNNAVITQQHSSIKVIGIRFALNQLVPESMRTNSSCPIPLNAIIHKDLLRRIDQKESIQEKVEEIQNVLVAIQDDRWKENRTSSYVVDGLNCIRQHFEDKLTIQQLSNELCITSKSLNRYFLKYTLLPPKKVFSIIRFRKSLKDYLINRTTFNFEKYSYHSPAHFYNDIKGYTGMYPYQIYKRMNGPLQSHHSSTHSMLTI